MNNKPLEIEYKFLIEYPDADLLRCQPDYKCQRMTQMYLTLPESFGDEAGKCRIRKIECDGKITFIKTFKQTVTQLTRIEIESEITEGEYNVLTAYRTADCFPICKTRHSFSYQGYTCEVDIFPFWNDRAFLEIEVDSEEITPPVPRFLRVIKDVSLDKRYRNSALARSIIIEPIE